MCLSKPLQKRRGAILAIARHPREEWGTGSPAAQARPVAHAERRPTSGQRGNQGGVFPRFSMHFWLSGSALNRPPALFAVSQRPIAVLTRRESYLALLSAAPPVEMGAVGLYMTQLKTCAEYSRSRRPLVALSRWSSPRWSSTACHFAPARRCMHWLIAPLSTLILVLLSPISADSSRPLLHQSTTPAYLISAHAAFVALTSSRPMLFAVLLWAKLNTATRPFCFLLGRLPLPPISHPPAG